MSEQQLRLLQYPEHLDRCYDDPNPYAYEHQVPVTWQILYAAELALETNGSRVVEPVSPIVSPSNRELVDSGSSDFVDDIHTPIIPILGSTVEIFTEEDMAEVIELHPLAEVIEFPKGNDNES